MFISTMLIEQPRSGSCASQISQACCESARRKLDQGELNLGRVTSELIGINACCAMVS